MATQSIEVKIPLEGISTGKSAPTFMSAGFAGETCRDATRALSSLLGKVTSDVATGECLEEPNLEELNEGG